MTLYKLLKVKKRDRQDKNPFTADQIQRLLELLETSKSSDHIINQIQRYTGESLASETKTKSKISWILDTGATDHVTHIKNHFISFHPKLNLSI